MQNLWRNALYGFWRCGGPSSSPFCSLASLETDAKRPAKYGEALALSGQRGLPIDSESDITESEQKNLIFVAGGDMHSLKYEGQR
jgi:hypothetical protein